MAAPEIAGATRSACSGQIDACIARPACTTNQNAHAMKTRFKTGKDAASSTSK
jgi:hypothetical protein